MARGQSGGELQSTLLLGNSPHTGSISVPPCTPSHVSDAGEPLNRAIVPLAKGRGVSRYGDVPTRPLERGILT